MANIRILSSDVITKIAAGEVIERPAYVVKELIENAIDAHADTITIIVEDSGLSRISVQDNGDGMDKNDITKCITLHATSKIFSEEDLQNIHTHGFRGEALASIAAVADVIIQSRTQDAAGGNFITVKNGKIIDSGSRGMPKGTVVIVENLFTNVPARKQFLKTQKTEMRLISDVVLRYCIAYPSLHIALIHNSKIIFDINTTTQTDDRLTLLFGETNSLEMLPISYTESYITLRGFIGKPKSASIDPKQFIFINNRFVTDKIVNLAVKEAFGTLIPGSYSPSYLLFLELPHQTVDVNIHPRKESVHFSDQELLFSTIKLAVSELLARENLTFNVAQYKNDNSSKKSETKTFSALLLKESVLPWDRKEDKDANDIILFHQTYILVPDKTGIILFDQHAVHERILFEQFSKAFLDKKNSMEVFNLEKPLALILSHSDSDILEEHKKLFLSLGFIIEHFQGTNYIIRSIPLIFKGRNIEKILVDLVSDIKIKGTMKSIDVSTQKMIAFLSCRAAVKAGETITIAKAKELLEALSQTSNNQTCPHGRPTTTTITSSEINSLFRRR